MLAEGMLAATEARGIPVRPRYTFKKVDKGDGDVRLCRMLADLSDRYGRDRVALLVGNRDLNKLRYTAELSPEALATPPDAKVSPSAETRGELARGLGQLALKKSIVAALPAVASRFGVLSETAGTARARHISRLHVRRKPAASAALSMSSLRRRASRNPSSAKASTSSTCDRASTEQPGSSSSSSGGSLRSAVPAELRSLSSRWSSPLSPRQPATSSSCCCTPASSAVPHAHQCWSLLWLAHVSAVRGC